MTSDPPEQIATLRIELRDSQPLIWRQVDVPTAMTLQQLHDVVQIAMGWLDSHLWELWAGKQRYGPPMKDWWGGDQRERADKVRLCDLLKPRRTTVGYLYDFGDSWEHRLIVTNVRDADPDFVYPRYVAGEGNCPPEDCGGLPGFYEMLEARGDPDHPDHDDIVEWLGDYDPAELDEIPIRFGLGRIARRRKAGKTHARKTDS